MRLGHYRRSCDRCHDQKLRCRRDDTYQSCQRCQRAKAKCTFSGVVQSQANNSDFSTFPPKSNVPNGASQDMAEAAALTTGANTGPSRLTPPDHRLCRAPKSQQAPLPDLATGRHASPLDFAFSETTLHDGDMNWDAMVNGVFPAGASSASTSVSSAADAQLNTMNMAAFSALYSDISPHKEFQDGGLMVSGIPQALDMATHSPQGSDQATVHLPIARQNHSLISRGVQQLSELGLELYDFAASMPSLSTWDHPGEYNSLKGKEFALDRVLEISQQFIETLDRLFPKLSKGNNDAAVQPFFDQPCQLVVLSSYLRIIEIYHVILEHIAACARLKRTMSVSNPVSEDRFIHLPSFAVGSFTMDSSSTTQVLVLVHIIEVMMTQSRHLIQCMVNSGKERDAPSMDQDQQRTRKPTAGEIALEGLRSTEEATLRMVETVRKLLFELGLSQS
ncbi:hypothetical protein SCAR479_11223 [Seiridium cardinale]|uniref:Zn(2)-C6 fungal-type domain-containing protein n=1 Tax=Seiridium cardinale TaxID=138064 RepID=A0ABR2XEF0_9PEZI